MLPSIRPHNDLFVARLSPLSCAAIAASLWLGATACARSAGSEGRSAVETPEAAALEALEGEALEGEALEEAAVEVPVAEVAVLVPAAEPEVAQEPAVSAAPVEPVAEVAPAAVEAASVEAASVEAASVEAAAPAVETAAPVASAQETPPPAAPEEPAAQEPAGQQPRIDDRLAPMTPEEQEQARRESALTEGPLIELPFEDEPDGMDLEARLDEERVFPLIRRAERQRGLLFFADDSRGDFDFVSVGPSWLPEHPGSQDLDLLPFYWVSKRFEDFTLQSSPRRFGVRASFPIDDQTFAGPVLAVSERRRQGDVDDPRFRALPDVDTSVLIGGFVELGVPGPFTDTDALTAEVEFLGALGGGVEGFTARTEVAYETLQRRELYLRPNISVQYSSGRYHKSLFDVTNSQAAANGISGFRSNGGFTSMGLGVDAAWFPGDDFGVTARVRYDWLLGEAQDNPFVRQAEEGQIHQVFVGLGFGWRL